MKRRQTSMTNKTIFKNGMFKENATFVSFLGMCPTLATTGSVSSAVGMGLATLIVLVLSNFFISLIKTITPAEIRIPVYVIVIATLVKVIQILLQAYVPSVYSSLGVYLPLIVVNCIVLGRAEAFASKNSVGKSLLDGIAVGLGFLGGLTLLGLVREVVGTGAISFASFFDDTKM
jgi:electron transport complex protein RnfE